MKASLLNQRVNELTLELENVLLSNAMFEYRVAEIILMLREYLPYAAVLKIVHSQIMPYGTMVDAKKYMRYAVTYDLLIRAGVGISTITKAGLIRWREVTRYVTPENAEEVAMMLRGRGSRETIKRIYRPRGKSRG
jgi:hypothetical protein